MRSDPGPWQEELDRLLAAVLDGEGDARAAAAIEAICRAHPEGLERVVRTLWLHGEFAWQYGGSAGTEREAASMPDEAAPVAPTPIDCGNSPSSRRWRVLAALLLAVASLACALAVRVVSSWSGGGGPHREAEANRRVDTSAARQTPDSPARRREDVTRPAADGVRALRAVVLDDPRLIHYYPLEGARDAHRLGDARGALPLQAVVLQGGRDRGRLAWNCVDCTGRPRAAAIVGFYGQTNAEGIALQTEEPLAVPARMSLAALLRLDAPAPPGAVDDDRFPFELPARSGSDLPTLRAIEAGDAPEARLFAAFGLRAGREDAGLLLAADARGRALQLLRDDGPWPQTAGFRFKRHAWYYVVMTFEAAGEHTRVSLDAHPIGDAPDGRSLARSIVLKGKLQSGRLGIGKGVAWPPRHAYCWWGAIDEVAVYDDSLSAEDIRRHVRLVRGAPKHLTEEQSP